jgi:hypothetical protein
MAVGAEPPLTSVDMCLEDVGRTAAEHLLAAINDAPTHGVQIVPSRLVIRESSDPQLQSRSAGRRSDRGPAMPPEHGGPDESGVAMPGSEQNATGDDG